MELLKTPNKGARLGDILHIGANVLFVCAIALCVFVLQLPLVALVLAFLSKWRILAVRPRYWSVNLRTNLLDLLFVISVTLLIINPFASFYASLFWTFMLALWLLVIKPRSTRMMMGLQAGVMQFVALTALSLYVDMGIKISQLYVLVLILGAWIIGYAVARHIATSFDDESKIEFFGFVWGSIVAQLVWLFSHWMFVYRITPGLEIPQIALIMLLLAFVAQRVYGAQRLLVHDERARKATTKQQLRSLYVAAGLAGALLIVVLGTTSWSAAI
ncbi:MAG TPA: hypothetical protein VFZ58_02430 [Candidatus Saccharimonadales bacterium]